MTKSVESLKKTELEQLLQEQKSQKERLACIESVLLEEQKERLAGIESVLLAIQDKFGKNRWGPKKEFNILKTSYFTRGMFLKKTKDKKKTNPELFSKQGGVFVRMMAMGCDDSLVHNMMIILLMLFEKQERRSVTNNCNFALKKLVNNWFQIGFYPNVDILTL